MGILLGGAVAPGRLPNGILILGAAKSGTSGLFYAVQHALQVQQGLSVTGLWEPRRSSKIEDYWTDTTDRVRLVKMLLLHFFRHRDSFVERFDRKVLIYRDPRDTVVSRLHFVPQRLVDSRDRNKVAAVIDLFREKELNPGCVSVLSMFRRLAEISARSDLAESTRENSLFAAKLMRERGSAFHAMPYDDLVACRFDALSAYLGFDVGGDFQLPERHAHVARSKASAAWKDWFVDEDIDFFARTARADFDILGFDADERQNPHPHIEAQMSSEYVSRLFQRMTERRALSRRSRQALYRSGWI